ncbi:MAG: molybdenum ABC transporter ATP-binding protein [Methylomicrobium sp.]
MVEQTIAARFRLQWSSFKLDVDLTLPRRGVTALFGPSGSGKTTLLRCIAGLERAQHGFLSFEDAIWQNDAIWLPPHRRPIGYIFQEASLFTHLNVSDNLHYGRRRIPKALRTPIEPIVELLGLGHLLDRKPDRLSGGERQRVAIARALAVNPQLLLMDEPLSALDLARKKEVLPYLERLCRQAEIPILYVSHSPDEVARLADYLVALENGRVVARGPLAETLARFDLPIRLGEETGVVIEAVVSERDERWHLARLAFPGGCLWLRDDGVAVGKTVRVRVLARDVSLSHRERQDSSITNTLPGIVDAIGDDEHPGLALVRVRIGASSVIARLTKRSAFTLRIEPGKPIWVQIKSAALME